jgi:hypothetical protein
MDREVKKLLLEENELMFNNLLFPARVVNVDKMLEQLPGLRSLLRVRATNR